MTTMATTQLTSPGSSALPLSRLRRVTDYIREHLAAYFRASATCSALRPVVARMLA